jgi:predicted NAD/FAD-dependent oxidoreductase
LFLVHLAWRNVGIAQFPPGRLREMTALHRRLAAWDAPCDLCGDYLDGLSSEGALRTGEEAAERTTMKLSK